MLPDLAQLISFYQTEFDTQVQSVYLLSMLFEFGTLSQCNAHASALFKKPIINKQIRCSASFSFITRAFEQQLLLGTRNNCKPCLVTQCVAIFI